jgi:hypothetical protein
MCERLKALAAGKWQSALVKNQHNPKNVIRIAIAQIIARFVMLLL